MHSQKLKSFSFGFCLLVAVVLFSCSTLHQVSPVSGTAIEQVLINVGLKMKAPAEKNSTAQVKCQSVMDLYSKNLMNPALTQTLKCMNSIKQGSVTYAYRFEKGYRIIFFSLMNKRREHFSCRVSFK